MHGTERTGDAGIPEDYTYGLGHIRPRDVHAQCRNESRQGLRLDERCLVLG